ncbi:DUF1453 family protein [Streptomyces sp. DG2A-72]|uniref:CcdC protein domain-containing protein n=1 Tax=Streptomyces sp. DG2A-72 TaxID=3051386 RepID=UPI00265BF68D|nr:CcdC protein domain-containing protein [Streptomyces sp. DG2A-72]MDO0937177.1 DUF1453 family protein [Streptomyces sp. DG2A-72]
MTGLVDALLIAAVAALVIVRQFRASRIGTGKRWWLAPAVLTVLALREPAIIDAHHRTESVFLLGAELLVGLATGAAWAWTTRIWAEPDGTVWSRGTRASVVVWVAGIALRLALFALGSGLGVKQDTSALLLALAITLLVRGGILTWRARFLCPTPEQSPAYGDTMSRPAWKEHV